jgi:hypothetical protein
MGDRKKPKLTRHLVAPVCAGGVILTPRVSLCLGRLPLWRVVGMCLLSDMKRRATAVSVCDGATLVVVTLGW